MFKKAFDSTRAPYVLSCLFLATVTTAVATGQMVLLLLPLALLGAWWALQNGVLLFYVLIATIPWSVEYYFGGTLSTDLPDEPLMLLAALSAVSLIIYRQKLSKPFGHPLVLILVLQVIWMAFTVTTSAYTLISFKFLLAKSWYLLAFVAFPLLVLITKNAWRNIAWVLSISMMVVTTIALVRHAQFGLTFADVNRSLYPFFRNHVNYSALLVCVLPLMAALYFHSQNKMVKSVLLVALGIGLVALYFSYARGAWLALFVGMAAYFFLRKKGLLWAYLLTLAIVVSAVFWLQHNNRYLAYAHDFNTTVFHTDFKDHLVATYQLKDVSTAERFYRWVAGVRMVKEAWQTGFGPNTFYYHYKPYAVTPFKTWVSDNPEKSTVHNYYLLTLIEQGVMGLLLLLFLLGALFYKAQQIYHHTKDVFWKSGAACAAVILAMICTVNFLSDLIETDKIGSIFYLCVSFLVIADLQTKKVKGF